MINLEINGKKLEVAKGTSIIEAADNAGIQIPRFCYHKNLSIAASCRMCLVEVDGVGKTLPACATLVSEGMRVSTKSEKVINSQKAIMEFLLINHPLDCPICDQGGECELQDIAIGYGITKSAYYQSKRSVFSTDISPLIETEMTRCILCTRCVRFGEEVSGIRELGVVNRGECSEIGTYVQHMLHSELSGNIIDICPVGALTAKPSRYSTRSWELSEFPSISHHDCVGSNIFIHTTKSASSNKDDLIRVVPRENNLINETWISDRDRFSYEGIFHHDRCLNPMVKTKRGRWKEITWDDALKLTAKVTRKISAIDPSALGFLTSSNATTEECYLFQKLARSLGTNNVDHRIRQIDFRSSDDIPIMLNSGIKIRDIENLDSILLIGSNIRIEQPIISYNIRKAFLNNKAKVIVINPSKYSFDFACEEMVTVKDCVDILYEVLDSLSNKENTLSRSTSVKNIVKILESSQRLGIFLGSLVTNSYNYSLVRYLCFRIKSLIPKSSITILTDGPNTHGAYFAGAVPEHEGQSYADMVNNDSIKMYYLLNFEPEHDTSYMHQTLKSLNKSCFNICLTPFVTKTMRKYADIILPIAPFSENEGTFINFEGNWQTFGISCQPKGNCKPAWQIFRALARLLHIGGMEYRNVQEIYHELIKKLRKPQLAPKIREEVEREVLEEEISLNHMETKNLIRIGTYPMYCTDSILRRAKSLQKSMTPDINCIMINKKTADRLNLKSGDKVAGIQGHSIVILPLLLDDRLANDIVIIPSGVLGASGFGISMAKVKLKRTTHEK